MQAKSRTGLPAPDSASAAHSRKCADYIRARINDAGGAISFAEFMHYALYAPGIGYYVAGTTKFGRAGDFVTAPEVSPIFGRVLAKQCAEVFEQLGGGSILEIGAGSGRLAVDVLKKLDALGALPEEYRILEVSADLQNRQEQTLSKELPDLADRVVWLDSLPQTHRGVVLANEVLDALPVERFRGGDVANQHVVVTHGEDFAFEHREAPAFLLDAVERLQQSLARHFSSSFDSEFSPGLHDWVGDLLNATTEGRVFLFDYGLEAQAYYAADRSDGWLRCHYRHHAHSDPLILPGIQDITAWVDFTAVASAAIDAGARISAWVSQAHFLIAGGLDGELQTMSTLSQAEQAELSAGVKMLTLPGEMGEPFKCMMLDKGSIEPPALFRSYDRTHIL